MFYNQLCNELREWGFVFETDKWGNDRYCPENDIGELAEEVVERFFKKNNIKFNVTTEKAFESPGYDCWIMAVAFLEDNDLKLYTFLLECC